ncbi:MAG: 3-isopropylmalate dehydratase large subunit [Thermosulfidibacteraceae bacterium]|jgi:3-isopropylmalate/(R)-2-methylmalate dehydratase large subunit
MGMTLAEKILAVKAKRDFVKPGEILLCDVDIALANDVTAPLAIKAFESIGKNDVFNRERIVLVMDHFTPNKDISSAMQVKFVREFAKKYGIVNYFEGGDVGIEHALLPELGLVVPSDLVIGADSHTCTYGAIAAFATGVGSTDLGFVMATGKIWLKVPETIKFEVKGIRGEFVTGKDIILKIIGMIGVDGARYKAMEFAGEVIRGLSMDERFTICNMAIEAGGKAGLIEPDEITKAYVGGRAKREPNYLCSDKDAEYKKIIEVDITGMEPLVAFPYLPENVKPVSEAKDIKIDQVVIGSCTNGRITDLRQAAEILRGKKAAKDVRLIVIPATPNVYRQALEEGLIEIFLDAGAVISPPTCGPCLGGHMGILAEGERAVATTNRNFVGRMGHPKSEVYLANPYVAAASAVLGRIAHPEEAI